MFQGPLSLPLFLLCLYDQGITPLDVYKINQLEAMWLADAASHEVDTTTIWNCWHKAGILPDTPSLSIPTINSNVSIPIFTLANTTVSDLDPIAHAKEAVNKTLNELQETDVLQPTNRMTVEQTSQPCGGAEPHGRRYQ